MGLSRTLTGQDMEKKVGVRVTQESPAPYVYLAPARSEPRCQTGLVLLQASGLLLLKCLLLSIDLKSQSGRDTEPALQAIP